MADEQPATRGKHDGGIQPLPQAVYQILSVNQIIHPHFPLIHAHLPVCKGQAQG